ncbi:MAG: hypothetical protein AVDCRST_MAG13-1022, partial [uncultured Solirubrobacteraceae bacterium]
VVAPIGIRLERQEGCPCLVEGTRPDLTLPRGTQAADPCNKAPRRPHPRPRAGGRAALGLRPRRGSDTRVHPRRCRTARADHRRRRTL